MLGNFNYNSCWPNQTFFSEQSFKKGQVPGKFTGLEDEFAFLVWPCREFLFFGKFSLKMACLWKSICHPTENIDETPVWRKFFRQYTWLFSGKSRYPVSFVFIALLVVPFVWFWLAFSNFDKNWREWGLSCLTYLLPSCWFLSLWNILKKHLLKKKKGKQC